MNEPPTDDTLLNQLLELRLQGGHLARLTEEELQDFVGDLEEVGCAKGERLIELGETVVGTRRGHVHQEELVVISSSHVDRIAFGGRPDTGGSDRLRVRTDREVSGIPGNCYATSFIDADRRCHSCR